MVGASGLPKLCLRAVSRYPSSQPLRRETHCAAGLVSQNYAHDSRASSGNGGFRIRNLFSSSHAALARSPSRAVYLQCGKAGPFCARQHAIGGSRSYYAEARVSRLGHIRQYDNLRQAIDELLELQKMPAAKVKSALLNLVSDKLLASPGVCSVLIPSQSHHARLGPFVGVRVPKVASNDFGLGLVVRNSCLLPCIAGAPGLTSASSRGTGQEEVPAKQ